MDAPERGATPARQDAPAHPIPLPPGASSRRRPLDPAPSRPWHPRNHVLPDAVLDAPPTQYRTLGALLATRAREPPAEHGASGDLRAHLSGTSRCRHGSAQGRAGHVSPAHHAADAHLSPYVRLRSLAPHWLARVPHGY